MQLKDNSGVLYLERAVNTVSLPFITASMKVTRFTQESFQTYLSNIKAQKENRQLREQIFRLRTQLLLKRNQDYENHRLKELLGLRYTLEVPARAATVIGNTSFSGMNLILIDRGERDGIRKDMAVINENGIVGRVWKVFSKQSQVQLISDPASGVAVRIDDVRSGGILSGTGDLRTGSIEYVPNAERVSPGARAWTTGSDGIYPKGVLAGSIISTSPGDAFFQNIQVEFASSLTNLTHVLVVNAADKAPAGQLPEKGY